MRPRSRNFLSIRSAERRRWAADLTGPGRGGLVVYGMGGIGKSTLAAQIVARVSRVQSGRVVNAISGEVSAASFATGPAETDFIILDNFDDNLSRQAGRWTVRDPALAHLLASWTGKLLITCRQPFTLGESAARPGHIAECEAAGLLTVGAGHELAVHRWTAGELHGRLAEADLSDQVVTAHRQAAGYWLSRAASVPSQHAELEAAYHQRRAAELTREPEPPAIRGFRSAVSLRRRKIVRYGVAGALVALTVVLAAEAGRALSAPHLAAAKSAASPASPASSVTGATVARDRAAAWVAGQVSAGAILACDPAMCAALAQHGIAAGNLLVLRSGAADPLDSDVVLATASVRGIFGARPASVYAPELLASFGTGACRVDVRIVAPQGAAAYRAALAADVKAREVAGAQLLRDSRITLTSAARAKLAAGQVDARLLITLAALAASEAVQVSGFNDDGPGASPGQPLRTAELSAPTANARAMLAFVRAQRSPFLPANAAMTVRADGEAVLTVAFTAPAPLGLLSAHN